MQYAVGLIVSSDQAVYYYLNPEASGNKLAVTLLHLTICVKKKKTGGMPSVFSFPGLNLLWKWGDLDTINWSASCGFFWRIYFFVLKPQKKSLELHPAIDQVISIHSSTLNCHWDVFRHYFNCQGGQNNNNLDGKYLIHQKQKSK